MTEKWDTCTNQILRKLAIQESRMQSIEMNHMKVEDFMKKFTEF